MVKFKNIKKTNPLPVAAPSIAKSTPLVLATKKPGVNKKKPVAAKLQASSRIVVKSQRFGSFVLILFVLITLQIILLLSLLFLSPNILR